MRRRDLEMLLPDVIRRTIEPTGPLDALLEAMRELHRPSEEVLATVERYFDPYRAPEAFLPFLARWVDLGGLVDAGDTPEECFPWGLGRLRELIAHAAWLSTWRGTEPGLRRFLELATGRRDFDLREGVDGEGRLRPFSLRVRAPADLAAQRPLLERVLTLTTPVHLETHLVFADAAADAAGTPT